MDAIWLAFPVGSINAVLLAYASYRWTGWRKHAEAPVVARDDGLDLSESERLFTDVSINAVRAGYTQRRPACRYRYTDPGPTWPQNYPAKR
jgi:hypothetical protein